MPCAPGQRRAYEAHRELFGMTPTSIGILKAVMTFEHVYGRAPTRREVTVFLGHRSNVHTRELEAGRWLKASADNHSIASQIRAHREFGFALSPKQEPEAAE